jgi:hypothetical protein
MKSYHANAAERRELSHARAVMSIPTCQESSGGAHLTFWTIEKAVSRGDILKMARHLNAAGLFSIVPSEQSACSKIEMRPIRG